LAGSEGHDGDGRWWDLFSFFLLLLREEEDARAGFNDIYERYNTWL